jgi:hypothetical protein
LTNNAIKTPDTNDDTIAVIVALIPSIVKYLGSNFKITKERKTQFLVLCGFEHMFILKHECVKVFTRMSVNYLYRNLPFTTFALLPLREYLQQQSIIDKKKPAPAQELTVRTWTNGAKRGTVCREWQQGANNGTEFREWHSVQIVAQSADSGNRVQTVAQCEEWHSVQIVAQCEEWYSVQIVAQCEEWHSVQTVAV